MPKKNEALAPVIDIRTIKRLATSALPRKIATWDDANAYSAHLAVLTAQLQMSKAKLEAQIAALRAKAADELTGLNDKIVSIESDLIAFGRENKADFGDEKSRKLIAATLGFRTAPPSWGYRKDEKTTIALLKAQELDSVIRTDESVIKGSIATLTDAQRKAVGIVSIAGETDWSVKPLKEAVAASQNKAA